MINSKQKGARAERVFANFLKDKNIKARRGQQFCGGSNSPDVITELKHIHFEVKWVEKLNLQRAFEQAKKDAGTKIPIVAHKKNKNSWMISLSANDFFELLKNK